MLFEFSYGVIPLKRVGDRWQVLLVQHNEGHWSFPKGHARLGETAQQTAVRELKEETGLDLVGFLSPLPLEEHYKVARGEEPCMKTVSYFLGIVDGEVSTPEDEIKDHRWVPLEEAAVYVTFPEAKAVCNLVQGHIVMY